MLGAAGSALDAAGDFWAGRWTLDGRMPPNAVSIVVETSDGEVIKALCRNNRWHAALRSGSEPTAATVSAHGATGAVVARVKAGRKLGHSRRSKSGPPWV
jgi:hypothetical protein